MPFRSAPSAKIRTDSCSTRLGSGVVIGEYPVYRLTQGPDGRIHAFGAPLLVPMIDEHRAAARGAAGVDVPPAIADHVAAREIDPRLPRGPLEQARTRLPAGATV